MARPPTFPKSLLRRMRDCEAHVKLLGEALRKMDEDEIYYKQVAAELRVLVADKKPRNQLLLGLVKELKVSLDLNPPKPPAEHWSIIEGKKVVPWRKGNIPLSVYCEKGYACVIHGRMYSNADLVRLIAQEEGSSHESPMMSQALATSSMIELSGRPIHVYGLGVIARTIEDAARAFLRFMVVKREYPARYDWR